MNIVEQYLELKVRRLAASKEVQKMEEQESELKQAIITALREGKPELLGSSASRVSLSTKYKPVAEDWAKIYQFIGKHNAFELLQRRLTESAVMERLNDGQTIPGINKFPVFDISITKG